MSERMTREQALERVRMMRTDHINWPNRYMQLFPNELADLLLAVQAETEARVGETFAAILIAAEKSTEQRVVAKCCEIAGRYQTNSGAAIVQSIRAAFPAQEVER